MGGVNISSLLQALRIFTGRKTLSAIRIMGQLYNLRGFLETERLIGIVED